MNKKIRIIAEEDALLQLSSNEEFNKGSKLKSILRNCAEIILIMDENEFGAQWEDSESNIRKFVQAYDMPKPRAISGLNKIYSNPGLCYKLDPFAIWFFNKSTADLKKFRNYLGVWAINTSELTDNFFYINHSREYEKNDRINGTRGNGWGNFLEQVPGFLPPINSIVINDRYLVYNTNEVNADKIGFAGLNNLKILLKELLPKNLKIPFHVLIYCKHPKLDMDKTDVIVQKFIRDVKNLRRYEIKVEIVFGAALHKRGLYSNYFLMNADRGFNAFYNLENNKLCGENDLTIKSYLNDAEASGDTTYDEARGKIIKISNACKEIFIDPIIKDENLEKISRVKTECDEFFYNRLFS